LVVESAQERVSAQISPAIAAPEHRFALLALTTLFFMWGFISCLNDILIPHLKNVFQLNYTQAMLIQFCFFGAYFVMSVPAGRLIHRIGYKGGLVVGLLVAGVGCILFNPAASIKVYALFLGALFVLASGITILQVAANPYVTALGPVETASSRLTLTQAFNSLGTTLAPFFGAAMILAVAPEVLPELGGPAASSEAELEAFRQAEADAVKAPYLMLAAALWVLAVIFTKLRLPALRDEDLGPAGNETSHDSIWRQTHLVLGALAIFLCVGGEVAIGSLIVNFLGEPHILGLDEKTAAQFVAYYWGSAMVGRFIGFWVMTKISAGKVLAAHGLAAIALLIGVVSLDSLPAAICILLIGLFNSIMFPTIFSLAVRDLGSLTSQGSGLLCLAIFGGAMVPLAQGALADSIGLQSSFVLPMACYAFIIFYGISGANMRPLNRGEL
jgi:FHS family L-fucose permease-like MFS transporter